MADVPKIFTLTGVTASTDFGTVPANKAWIIKSALVYQLASSTDVLSLSIGGDKISGGGVGFSAGADKSLDLLKQTQDPADGIISRTVIAEASEIVRLVFISGSTSKNARISVIEIDV